MFARARPWLRTIDLPRGPEWHLVLFRWVLIAASIYTVVATWHVWQVRTSADFPFSPMLPTWDGLPQFDFGWLIIGCLLSILAFPRTGMTLVSAVLVLSVLWDQMRLQPHYQLVLLLWGTLPSAGAQFFGRMSLVALWFWVGFHKLLIDFIKPMGMAGFVSDIIPNDLNKFYPREQFPWNTIELGMAVGWIIGIGEASLAILCLVPRTRKLAAIVAFALHCGILWWNCLSPWCNLIGFNVVLALAGFFMIWPWRETPLASWKQCNWPIRIGSLLLLIYPAAYYVGWVPGYLSYCIYVPNTPFPMLYRPGEDSKFVPMLPVPEINFPLPPGQQFAERWFEKVRKPGDVLVIHDPRPWAEARGLNGRQITDLGRFPRGDNWRHYYETDGTLAATGSRIEGDFEGLWVSFHRNGKIAEQGVMVDGAKQGRWVRMHDNGVKASEGDYDEGFPEGPWTFWYPDGKKEAEGAYRDGKQHGKWRFWSPEGVEEQMEFRDNMLLMSETPSSSD